MRGNSEFFINFATKLYGGCRASTYNIDKTLMTKSRTKKIMDVLLFVFISLVLTKSIWVMCVTSGHGSFDGEKKEIIRRANYLTSKVATTPQKLLDEMPSGIGEQFQGEWALYTCSCG